MRASALWGSVVTVSRGEVRVAVTGADDAGECAVFALGLTLGDPIVAAGDTEGLAVERNDAER